MCITYKTILIFWSFENKYHIDTLYFKVMRTVESEVELVGDILLKMVVVVLAVVSDMVSPPILLI